MRLPNPRRERVGAPPGKREVLVLELFLPLPNPHLCGRSPVNLGSNIDYYLSQPRQQ